MPSTRNRFALSLAVLGLSASAHATDRVVGPGGFTDIGAAIAVASPGDRILLAQDTTLFACMLPPVMPEGLVFESAPGTGFHELLIADPGGTWFVPTSVTFRRLRIVVDDPGGLLFPQNSLVVNAPDGTVRFFDVEVEDRLAGIVGLPGSGGTRFLVSIVADEVLVKDCRFVAQDGRREVPGGIGACDDEGAQGTDALRVVARRLVLEDTELHAGSANVLCEGDPLGDGGAALTATTDQTVLVRTTLRDGNGGFTAAPPFASPPVIVATTSQGLSTLGSLAHASGSTWTFGLHGSHPAVLQAGGVTVPIGAEAPLLARGGQAGFSIDLEMLPTVDPADTGVGYAIGIGFETPGVQSPFGELFTNPFDFNGLPSGTSESIPLPAVTSSIGRVIVFETIHFPPIRFGNPSFVEQHL